MQTRESYYDDGEERSKPVFGERKFQSRGWSHPSNSMHDWYQSPGRNRAFWRSDSLDMGEHWKSMSICRCLR